MFRRDITSKAGFSLVELMIVIAIIATLIAIALPSFAKAREQARRAVCGAHLHALGLGWETYATEWGALPMMARRAGDINLNQANGRVLEPTRTLSLKDVMVRRGNWAPADMRNMIFHVDLSGRGRPGPSFPGKWQNWGLLYKNGSVRAEGTFYCPSQRNPFLARKTQFNPWPPRGETAFLPDGTANHTESSFERRLGLSHVRWERVPLRTVVATDVLSYQNIQETHRKGVNAVFRDGHVSFLANPELLDQTVRLDQYKFINDGWKRDILALYEWLDARY